MHMKYNVMQVEIATTTGRNDNLHVVASKKHKRKKLWEENET